MKEHGILFRSDMVRAILEGRKTQTRRLIKFKMWQDTPVVDMTEHFEPYEDSPKNFQCWTAVHSDGPGKGVYAEQNIFCPQGFKGDRLWVKETYRPCKVPQCSDSQCLEYKASDHCKNGHLTVINRTGWKPSMFMPRWASRIDLEILSVRAERLQDITEEDAISEGAPLGRVIGYGRLGMKSHKEGFMELWHSINTKPGRTWDDNPFVWRLEFKRISP